MKLTPAKLDFNQQGTPVATDFDDVYFSNLDGLKETQHVFIKGNQLIERFQTCQLSDFVIAETGFGTGLNFLVTLDAFETFRNANPEHNLKRLYFISAEKYPLDPEALKNALQCQPFQGIQKLAKKLIDNYPLLIPGAHRINFTNATLDLWFGDVTEIYQALEKQKSLLVDAWYLDGFAPSKNPSMWSKTLFNSMAASTADNGTLATFTAAGFVRRGLQEAGFDMAKVPGFGTKREMLIGTRKSDSGALEVTLPVRQKIAVIGAGIAGANLVYALAKRGHKLSLFSDKDLASGASGNPQGGFYPHLHLSQSPACLLQVKGFDFALRLYRELIDAGFSFEHEFCGVLQLAYQSNIAKRQSKIIASDIWPPQLLQQIDSHQASKLANIPLVQGGIYFEQGGWISPSSLVSALLAASKNQSEIALHLNTSVANIETTKDGMACVVTDTDEYLFDHVVIATGADRWEAVEQLDIPFRRVRGQVEALPSNTDISQLKTVLCHKGYLTPAQFERHAMGSTYIREDENTGYRQIEGVKNLATHETALAGNRWAESFTHDFTGRASIRMSTPDHLPVCGSLQTSKECPSKISILSALGSRGLTTAPILAEYLSSRINSERASIDIDLFDAVSPYRFTNR